MKKSNQEEEEEKDEKEEEEVGEEEEEVEKEYKMSKREWRGGGEGGKEIKNSTEERYLNPLSWHKPILQSSKSPFYSHKKV